MKRKTIERYNEIANQYKASEWKSVQAFSESIGVTYEVVRSALVFVGVKINKQYSSNRDKVNAERDEQILEMYFAGNTLQTVGDYFGVTRERVRQIINKCGQKPRNDNHYFPEADTLEEAFWLRVNKTDNLTECWSWIGSCNSKGYGSLSFQGKRFAAHKLSLELKLGRKVELLTLHECDTPSCVNPNHLREGTAKDNHNNMVARNRAPFQCNYDVWYSRLTEAVKRRERHYQSKLSHDQVREIKLQLASGRRAKDIAQDFNLTITNVSHIKTGRTYKNVSV